jgi:hypothetical protein
VSLLLVPGEWRGIIASLDPEPSTDAAAALARRLDHDRTVLATAFPSSRPQQAPPWIARLALATDAFLFARPLANVPDGKSVLRAIPGLTIGAATP